MTKTVITTVEATDIIESNKELHREKFAKELAEHFSKIIGHDDIHVRVQIFEHDAHSCIAAEPTRSMWTPITPTTMPKNCEDVLLCNAKGERVIGHAMHLLEFTSDNDTEFRYLWRIKSRYNSDNYTPVAWMPLPEAYKPD